MYPNGGLQVDTTDDIVGLIWEELVETDRMCRYYAYLAERLDRQGALLQIGSVAAASGAVVSLMSHFPGWAAATAAAGAAVAGAMVIVRRYPEKAARSAELFRALGRERIAWERLWGEVEEREEAELRVEWEALSQRLVAIVERAPLELPLSRSLARRSERESDKYWTERYAST